MFHSWHCSRICLKVKMWSPQDFSFLKPACSLHNSGSKASEILSRITLLKTLLVIDNRVILLQFLERLRSPFFGSLTISSIFQSPSVSSVSHIPSKISVRAPMVTSPPAFNIVTSGYLDLVQRLEFGVDHLQKNAVYQIE